MAEWTDIRGYAHYLISNEGHIKRKGDNDNPEFYWSIWKNGTTTLRDSNNKLSKIISIRRLVAEHFVECKLTDKPNRDCYYVKHIDGDLKNNRVDNLYWSISTQGPYTMRRRPR